MLVKGAFTLLGQLIGLAGEKGKAKQAALQALSDRMARTWVDEIIALYWFAPTMLAMFGFQSALDSQVAMIAEGSYLFQTQVGITAAVFGLGKLAR